MINANPTTETQKKILETIRNTTIPMSLTAIAKESKTSLNAVKQSVIFLKDLKVIETVVSSGNVTLVMPIKSNQMPQNAIPN